MNTNKLAANIINAAEIARANCKKSDAYTVRAYGPAFKKLSADKGIGRFLIHINNNPGRTKPAILEGIFGNKPHAHFNESFTNMKAAGLIVNEKRETRGYYITDLGLAILKQFSLI